MFASDTPEHEMHWRPGQSLPTTSAVSTFNQPTDYGCPDLQSTFQEMRSSFESNLRDLKCHIAKLQDRVTSIEDRQKQLELQHFSSSIYK